MKKIFIYILMIFFSFLFQITLRAEILSDPLSSLFVAQKENSISLRSKNILPDFPLSFEENRGQADDFFSFIGKSKAYNFAISPEQISMNFPHQSKAYQTHIHWLNPNPHAKLEAQNLLDQKTFYYLGSDAQKWQKEIPHYSQVKVAELYPHIDLVYYGRESELEFDFEIAAGADPNQIRFEVSGDLQALSVDQKGNLVIQNSEGILIHQKPIAYQWISGIAGQKKEIPLAFKLLAKNQIGFEISPYDPHQTLIIDPVIKYDTYMGGNTQDAFSDLEVDSKGYVYALISSNATDVPTHASPVARGPRGDWNCIINKIDPTWSSIVFTVVLGGDGVATGRGENICRGLEVDAKGNIYVAGYSRSANYPVLNQAYGKHNPNFPDTDTIFSKLDASGNLLYSTYIGGDSNDDLSRAGQFYVDSNGIAYLTPITYSCNFPTTASAIDTSPDANCLTTNRTTKGMEGTLVKIDPTQSGLNSILLSTYIGGTDPLPTPPSTPQTYSYESILSVKTDSLGNIYLAGGSTSSDFPFITPGAYDSTCGTTLSPCSVSNNRDGVLVVLNPNGTLRYGTFLGGAAVDTFTDLLVESPGVVLLIGTTQSADFPVTAQAMSKTCTNCSADIDSFIARFDTNRSTLEYSSFLGGVGRDAANYLAKDSSGAVLIAGGSNSNDFPLKNSLSPVLAGGVDAFLTMLDPTLKHFIFSSFFGGNGSDSFSAVKTDSSHAIYLGGTTYSSDLPIPKGYTPIQRNLNSISDGYLLKLEPSTNLSVSFSSPTTVSLTSENIRLDVLVSNIGMDADLNGLLLLDIPEGMRLVSYALTDPNLGTCSESSPLLLSCRFPYLDNDPLHNTIDLSVVVELVQSGSLNMQASIAGTFNDSDTSNNKAQRIFTANLPTANLALSGSNSTAAIPINEGMSYTFSLRNLGPQAAQNIELQNNIPTGFTLVPESIQISQGTCTSLLVCRISQLGNNESVDLSFRVRATQAGIQTQNLRVSAETLDTDLLNNTLTQSNTVLGADKSIVLPPSAPNNPITDPTDPPGLTDPPTSPSTPVTAPLTPTLPLPNPTPTSIERNSTPSEDPSSLQGGGSRCSLQNFSSGSPGIFSYLSYVSIFFVLMLKRWSIKTIKS